MGLYYKSIFRNRKTTKILSCSRNLIDEQDIKIGYVSKSELLDKYGHIIYIEDIDDFSFVEDYEICTLSTQPTETIIYSLKVI